MNVAMHTAFDAASGGTAGAVAMFIILAVAASIVLWGANAIRMLLIEVMHTPKLFGRNCWLVMRALMIVTVFIYLLT
ncbi:hypothetical protein CLU93_5501 [Janthinobacterium sp. 35]|uniref:hypothetical protein n=1 Tax=Janthinobacterium sp. 35 TaxID=2035210 RepID=UPI000C1A1F5D|nr:hypothetical protein [Janthinobacterium sp. 35]PIG25437.1 hypothetical protein CLU93_5501 [Janthinobacterium sp. 35]